MLNAYLEADEKEKAANLVAIQELEIKILEFLKQQDSGYLTDEITYRAMGFALDKLRVVGGF